MDNHAISNGFIAGTISFFAYVVLIVGLLVSGAFLFLSGPEITPARVITAAAIAIGSVSSSFPMLAISRILEKVSAYSPCSESKSAIENLKASVPVSKPVAEHRIPATEEEMGKAYDEYLAEMSARSTRSPK